MAIDIVNESAGRPARKTNVGRVLLRGTVSNGSPIEGLVNINAPLQTTLGGLQTLGGSGLVGGPPFSPGYLAPEVIPDEATLDELLNPVTASIDAYNRILARMPNYNPDALIRGKGYKTLDEMKNFSAYNCYLRLKKYACTKKDWQTLPRVNGKVVTSDHPRYDRANEIAEFCEYALQNIYNEETGRRQDFREVAWYFLDACHSGNSTQEVVWRIINTGKYKGLRAFSRFVPRAPQQITYNLNPLSNEVVSINNYTALGWQSYLPVYKKFFMYTYQGEGGLPWGRGDARACYKHVFAMNEIIRWWGIALQKHGGGFLKGTTSNPNSDYITKFVEQLDQAQSANSIVITTDKSVELMSLPGGALDAFRHPIKYHEEAIAKEILGNILTTGQGEGSSSYALGGVHQDTEEYFRTFPRHDLEVEVRDQLYYWLVMSNFGEEDLDCLPAHFQGVWNWEEMNMMADFITKMTEQGYMLPQRDTEIAWKMGNLPYLPTTVEVPEANDPEKQQEATAK